MLKTQPDSNASSYRRTRPCASSSYRQFHPSWLDKDKWPWLSYSQHFDGAYCRACVFFAPEQAGGQALGQFVKEPFTSWIKMSQKATAHAKNDYHDTAMTKMDEFLARYENPLQAIDTLLDNELKRVMETNPKVIESLFKVVMLCGKQGLALRGHRDDSINWEEEGSSNEGKFVQLLRFRAETDPILSDHLAKSPKSARYTSKTIQNELVSVIGTRIQSEIVDEVKRAKFFFSNS